MDGQPRLRLRSVAPDAAGVTTEAGPEVAKRPVHELALGAVPGDVVRVRLESAPSLWLIDHVALDPSPAPGSVTMCKPLRMVPTRDGAGTVVAARLAAVQPKGEGDTP